MQNVDINYFTILAFGMVFKVVGDIWHSPLLFRKLWTKVIGKYQEKIQEIQHGGWE